MSEVESIQLEWKYSPANFLEEPISLSWENIELNIDNGIAVATIEPDLFHSDPSMNDRLTNIVKSRLLAVQIMSHSDYELEKPVRTDLKSDGKKHYFLEAEPAEFTLTGHPADIVIKDKDGNVISNSKNERLEKHRNFAEFIERFIDKDTTLEHILNSYQSSVRDPDDELVHLYEIRDSLVKRFGSVKSAINGLGITKNDWRKIGNLANNLPLRQGRHRGKSVGQLRNAEKFELNEARKAAVYLIEKYLEYLDHEENR